MKILPKVILASVLVALMLLPLAATSDQLPAPLEKTLMPGVTVIDYADQHLRFTTAVPLQLRLLPLDATHIQLQFRARGIQQPGGGSAPSSQTVEIFWEDWNNDIYSGSAPEGWWSGILATESGFTEK